tara:strand:+ start:3400 stop:3861 length:462 start_codon:yes stop_codon:yes gene_type:complete
MSFNTGRDPRNQQELVEKYLAENDGDPVVEEELDAIGIAKMHEMEPEEMVGYLGTLLKSRKIITRVKWILLRPDQDETEDFRTQAIRWKGIENLVGQTREEISSALIGVFGSDSKVVGVEWEPGSDRITAFMDDEDREEGMEGRFWVEHDTSR